MATTNPRLVARLHTRALKELRLLQGRLTLELFAQAVNRSVAWRFRDTMPASGAVSTYIDSLNAADLGLAVLCEAGDDTAWEHAVLTYRPLLYRAAGVLTGTDDAGRELADTLWAELYGVGHTRSSVEPGGERQSLFRYFHGRSTLSTWLRSVLAQRHVDQHRYHRRTVPLDADESRGETQGQRQPGHGQRSSVEPTDPDRTRYTQMFHHALQHALAALDPHDRLRLAYYYVQSLTLAETGRLLDEHEATVSRKLARARARLRHDIEQTMRERHRLTPAEIDLCYQYVVEEGCADLSGVLEP